MSDDDASSPAKLTPPAEDPSQVFPTRGRGGGGGSTSSGRGSGTPPPSPSQPQVAPPPLVEQGIYTFGPGAGSRPQAAQPQAEAAQPVAAQPQPSKTDPSIYRFGPPSAQAAAHSQVATAQQQSQPQAPQAVVQPQPQPTPAPQRTYANATRGDKPAELKQVGPAQAHAAGFKHTQFPLMDGSFKDRPESVASVYQLDAGYSTQFAVEENGLPPEIKVAGLFAKEIIAVVAPGENTLLFFKGVALEPHQKIVQITFRLLNDAFDGGDAGAERVVFIGTAVEAKEHITEPKEVTTIGWMKDTKYSQFRGYPRPPATQTVAVGGNGATTAPTSPVMMTLSNLTSGGGTANWASIRMKPGSGVSDRVAFMRHTTKQFLPPGTQAFMRGTTIRICTPEPLTADHKAALQKVPGIHSVFLDVLPRRAQGAPGAPPVERSGPSKTELAQQELANGIHEEYKECAALMSRLRESNPTHDIRVFTSAVHSLLYMKPMAEKFGLIAETYSKLNAVVITITNAEFLANPVSRRDSVSISGAFMLRREIIDPTLRA